LLHDAQISFSQQKTMGTCSSNTNIEGMNYKIKAFSKCLSGKVRNLQNKLAVAISAHSIGIT